ncbi:hypothetical protein SDC49_24205 [Lactobacillus sp. R2/2]|nr:hypothetical protein [Lactobacillus sp. R2/2]
MAKSQIKQRDWEIMLMVSDFSVFLVFPIIYSTVFSLLASTTKV